MNLSLSYLKYFIFTPLILFASCSVSMQSVKTLDLNSENVTHERVRNFVPVEETHLDSTFNYIGQISLQVKNGKQTTLDKAFNGLRLKAASYGANIYTFDSPICSLQNSPCEVVLSLYSSKDFDKVRETLPPSNTVYVFGSISSSDSLGFQFNDENIIINPFRYWYYHNEDLHPHVLEAGGGLLGSSIELSTKEETPPSYWMLSGSSLSPSGSPLGSFGISFSKGSFNKISRELGYFLTKVLGENDS